MAAVSFGDLPLASQTRRWNGAAANRRVRRWAGAQEGPTARYRRAFAWYDARAEDNFTAYKLQIADIVGVHETTVSRAISGKYMSTPQGVFEMKYFFTPGYQTSSGESMSNTSVKEAIMDLVKNEDSASPLSDKEIVEILSERGIPIARRTVAKYRTELNILPSNMRRKY